MLQMEKWQNNKPPKTFKKLNEFLTKYRSLHIKVQESQTTELKFEAEKNLINVFNSKTIKPRPNKKIQLNQFGQVQESQEMYFRQLNKMCEGQEQFQINKNQEEKKTKNKYCKQKVKQKENQIKRQNFISYSSHGCRNNTRLNCKNKQQQNKNKKFIELPDFTGILMGCSAGYAKKSTQSAMRRQINRFKLNLSKSNWNTNTQKQKIGKRYFLKNQKIKQQIKYLKDKAKNLYKLQFDQFEPKVCQGQETKLDRQFKTQNLNEICNNQTQKSKTNLSQSKDKLCHIQTQQNNKQNYLVPTELLKIKQKLRPFSVGFNKMKFNNFIKTSKSYFRI